MRMIFNSYSALSFLSPCILASNCNFYSYSEKFRY